MTLRQIEKEIMKDINPKTLIAYPASEAGSLVCPPDVATAAVASNTTHHISSGDSTLHITTGGAEFWPKKSANVFPYPTGGVPTSSTPRFVDNVENAPLVLPASTFTATATPESILKIVNSTQALKATPPAKKHNHYFKDVSHLTHIDVYRVLDIFSVTDQAIGHALKKLLVAGGRGAGKDINKDIQEAIDSLVRWQEMQKENNVR